jgi:hypothetical protein
MASREKRMVARTERANPQQLRKVKAAQANVKRELAKRRKEGKSR